MPGIKDFREKVTLITGAGSGIGRATALAFAAQGADLVIVDKEEDRIAEAAKEIEARGARVLARKVDVSDCTQVDDLARFVMAERGRVDILYNNAGIGVSTICPGVINTRVVADGCMNLREESRANRQAVVEFYKKFGWPPERVARAVLSAVRHNRSVVPVGPESWIQWIGKRLSQKGYELASEFMGRFLM